MLLKLLTKKRSIPKASSSLAKTAIVSTAGLLASPGKSPDEAYRELFDDVQKLRVFEDGKTFGDMIPRKRARELRREYELARRDPDFDLQEFINRHFYELKFQKRDPYLPSSTTTPREHVTSLWAELRRRNLSLIHI